MSLVTLNKQSCRLTSPTAMPDASGFLWNEKMLLNVNCRGYVTSTFMQGEPAKYSRGPNIEATTFIQPEHPYFAHHPGRFFYIKDEQTGELFSAPYEPVRNTQASFEVEYQADAICWKVVFNQVQVELKVFIAKRQVVELWQCRVTNLSGEEKELSIYPYFSVGYMSWMNQSAQFDAGLNGIVCRSIAPYQKLEDYDKDGIKKDISYLLCQQEVMAYETCQKAFEGEGGLHQPSAVAEQTLANGECFYQTPVAALQFRERLSANQSKTIKLAFGAAANIEEVQAIKAQFIDNQEGFEQQFSVYKSYIQRAYHGQKIECKSEALQDFVNNWLPRQVYYHGDVHRLTTDPQTRNYLQDAMGMIYIEPSKTRQALITTCQQQKSDGSLPDGILLTPEATLKYINQIPHADHNIWLVITLLAYLDETNELSLLVNKCQQESDQLLYQQVNAALEFLLSQRDDRLLSYIKQGDWCDPMNMVGYKGKGVSTWLSQATIYVLRLWAKFWQNNHQQLANIGFEQSELAHQTSFVDALLAQAQNMELAVSEHCWQDQWFARGITDDNVLFGIKEDKEGKIFLNPQSWALLSESASEQQIAKMLPAIDEQLVTPYGVMMLAPAYTQMREDVGRVTQKFPGTAENGSVYNHAAVFYAYSLLRVGFANKAFEVLEAMLPNEQDFLKRGQLPMFIPNYYRGAYFQIPQTAGKSSGLFNTGTVAWFMRCIVEEVYGLKGCSEGLLVTPKFPEKWQTASITRQFRGVNFQVNYQVVGSQNNDQKGNKPLPRQNCEYKVTVNNTTLVDKQDNPWQTSPVIHLDSALSAEQNIVEVEIKYV